MIRYDCPPRPDFQKRVRDQGLIYHTNPDGSPYWRESAYYAFTSGEVDRLYAAAKELHQMFLHAAGHVLEQEDGLTGLDIPTALHDVIRRSWERDQWEFYGRFDLTFDARGVPKLIEYNADTPTGLLEASIIQWYWKEDLFPGADQFNSIHESLVTRWKDLIEHEEIARELIHLTFTAGHPEDRMTAGYIGATAEEAGLPTAYLSIDRIGWDSQRGEFVDEENRIIRQLFKLYPWEWMGTETFAPQLGLAHWTPLEPAWKTLFASKKLLLTLQELYPEHPYLLRVSDREMAGDAVAKPVFGREGANVTIRQDGVEIDKQGGNYSTGDFIFQEYCPLVQAAPGIFAQCGVWMAGPEPVGLGVREDRRPILTNTSEFVPHLLI